MRAPRNFVDQLNVVGLWLPFMKNIVNRAVQCFTQLNGRGQILRTDWRQYAFRRSQSAFQEPVRQQGGRRKPLYRLGASS
jgi:hypothetical protein